jgi:hypothetical protein
MLVVAVVVEERPLERVHLLVVLVVGMLLLEMELQILVVAVVVFLQVLAVSLVVQVVQEL